MIGEEKSFGRLYRLGSNKNDLGLKGLLIRLYCPPPKANDDDTLDTESSCIARSQAKQGRQPDAELTILEFFALLVMANLLQLIFHSKR